MSKENHSRAAALLTLLELPQTGWKCTDVINRGRKNYTTCDLCGAYPVRYVHLLQHEDVDKDIAVGCICAEYMLQDYVTPKERENKLRRDAAAIERRLKKEAELAEAARQRELQREAARRQKEEKQRQLLKILGESEYCYLETEEHNEPTFEFLGYPWLLSSKGNYYYPSKDHLNSLLLVCPSKYKPNMWYCGAITGVKRFSNKNFHTVGAAIDFCLREFAPHLLEIYHGEP